MYGMGGQEHHITADVIRDAFRSNRALTFTHSHYRWEKSQRFLDSARNKLQAIYQAWILLDQGSRLARIGAKNAIQFCTGFC
jgi:hypothetical protein